MVINLQEKYETLRQEMPKLTNGECSECGKDMITELDVSYLPNRDQRIKIFRPAKCVDCSQTNGIVIKILGEIAANGKIYPKNKERRLE